MKKRRQISMALVIIMLLSIFKIDFLPAQAASLYMKWNKNDTLDSGLTVVKNKAGDNEVLLELDVTATGNYQLEYYLEDSRKTTVTFQQQYDRLNVFYNIEEKGTIAHPIQTSVTQELINRSYREINYSMTVPDWVFNNAKPVNGAGEIEYTILKSAGAQYPGVAFEIDGKKVIIKWDFQNNKVFFLVGGYTKGQIMPVLFTVASGNVDTMSVLKGLEAFTVKPTHLAYSSITENKDVNPIISTGIEKPGSRPGMQISFKQPKEVDYLNDDWSYKIAEDLTSLTATMELESLNEDAYMDIMFNMNKSDGLSTRTISSLPAGNAGVSYVYEAIDLNTDGNVDEGIYTINIVQDKDKTANYLANTGEIVEWNELDASTIYNMSIKFGASPNYEFTTYLPESKFAYTYMEYEIRRANISEALLVITPFDAADQGEIEYTILYSKTAPLDNLDPNEHLWVKHYYASESTEGSIYIPVPFQGESNHDYYQIIVKFSGEGLMSQVLDYVAEDDLNIPPTTPKIDAVDRLYVVPSDDEAITDPIKAQFDLVWTAPDNHDTKELDKIFENNNPEDRIYYELMVNDVPTDTIDNPFEVIKIFEVKKEGGEYKLSAFNDGTVDLSDPNMWPASINYAEGYSSDEQLFRMENITLFDEATGEWPEIIDVNANEDTNEYIVTPTGDHYDFECPGVNYIRIRAVTRIGDSASPKIGISYSSLPYSLSLNPTAYEIPITEELAYKALPVVEEDTSSIALSWHTVDIRDYVDAMLAPVLRSLGGVYYGIYISEDRDKIENLTQVATINPSIILGVDDPIIDIGATELQNLRDKEVLLYDIGTIDNPVDLNRKLELTINGLDKNTNYYVRIVTKADIIESDGTTHIIKMADPSWMLSATTPSLPDAPDDTEVKPLSVDDLVADFADNAQLNSRITWTYPDATIFATDEFAFEMISIEDRALPEEVTSTNTTLEELMAHDSLENDQLEYWRVIMEEVNGKDVPKLYKYDGTDWIEQVDLLEVEDRFVSVTDDSNTPNRVYYYYVRTVNIKGGNIMSHSPWQMDTLTTIPVKGPTNLIASYDSGHAYDGKTESIIRFDAPIPDNADYLSADPEYVMEIYVKGEDDSEYTMTDYPAEFIEQTDAPQTGYVRLYYKIEDLKPGKAYSIKVRIEDRTIDEELLPDGSSAYPKSPFSDRIIVRTEFDQDEYDEEVKFEEYLDYFDSKVKELGSGAYIVLEKSNSKNIVKYRDSYGEGELLRNKKGTYTLFTEDVKTNIIYLPANFINTVNDNNITLMIQPNEHSLSIRPYSLGEGITEEVNEKVDEINDLNSDLLDYYVMITVECSTSKTILSKSPSSYVVDIKVDIVGSETLEEDIETRMLAELKSVISFKREALINALEKQLDKGIDEEKMLEITKEAIESVKDNFQFGANLVFVDRIEDHTDEVTSLEKNMLIGLKPKSSDFGLQVYMKSGTNWIVQQSNYYSSRYTTESMALTSYVLLPQSASGVSLEGSYTDVELNLINKYKLYDVFNSSELSNTNTSLSKYRMISAFANVLGMSNGSNETQFLKEKGISVPTTNMYGTLTKAEVLYLYTQVFAVKNNIKLNNVFITNYNMIQDIDKVDKAYRNTLLIGANMKMFNLVNGMILPNNTITIKEFFELLYRIEQGLN